MSDEPWRVVLRFDDDRGYGEVTVFLVDGAKPVASASRTFESDLHPTKLADMVKAMASEINDRMARAAQVQEQLGDQFRVILHREIE